MVSSNDADPLFHFHDKVDVPRLLFAIAVTIAAIAPRMPLDRPWTIGGNVSRRFRQLLFVITGIYILKHALDDFIPSKTLKLII